nr:DUF6509 family protein [Priestia koreensis]
MSKWIHMLSKEVRDTMLEITSYTVEKLKDPFGILSGDRYEFFLDVDVPEDDELYNENGLRLKVILSVTDEEAKIVQYHFYDRSTDKYIDFSLEEDEEQMVLAFCKERTSEAEEQ